MRSFVLRGDAPLPNAAISDTGKLVKYLVEQGDAYHKRTIAFNSQSISEVEKLETLRQGMADRGSHAKTNADSGGVAYNIPVRYEQTPEHQFRESLESEMGPVTALDFTEQLMIFDKCGMVYDSPEFVQASQVSRPRS